MDIDLEFERACEIEFEVDMTLEVEVEVEGREERDFGTVGREEGEVDEASLRGGAFSVICSSIHAAPNEGRFVYTPGYLVPHPYPHDVTPRRTASVGCTGLEVMKSGPPESPAQASLPTTPPAQNSQVGTMLGPNQREEQLSP